MPNEAGIELSERHLAQLRKAAGKNQTTLAHSIGIGQSALSKILSGRRRPSTKTLRALAQACGYEVRVETHVVLTKRREA